MSSLQNAPRMMRRHKRRIQDDGSDLAHAVRDFIDSAEDKVQDIFARQDPDSANNVGPGRSGGSGTAPAMGGNGGFFGGNNNDGSDTDSASQSTPTSTRASGNGGGGSGNSRPSATSSSTPIRNLFTTATAPAAAATTTTSADNGLLGDISNAIFGSSSTSSSTSTSTSSSTSSTPSTTSTSTTSSSSTRSNSSSSTSSSSSYTPIVPITATAVVTSTPTASIAEATQSAVPKSTSSSAGPIIGIVAGALVGVVVLSGLVGFLFKKYKNKEDPYEANPFDRDAFQRHSAMIPDHFDSDEGHGGAAGMSPEMSEHYQYQNYGPQYESGISAGAAGAMGAMAAHNENGGPRPPTMFAKHAANVHQNQPQVGGYYKDGDFSQVPDMPSHSDYHAPPVAAFANHHADQQYLDEPGFGQQRSISPAPQLPPLAAFGGDPYSIAGVGRGQQQAQNVANPYAHLDRSHGPAVGGFVPGAVIPNGNVHHPQASSVSSRGSADQRHASISAAEALAAGLAHQASLNRSTSPNHPQEHDTAGRPSSSEGRSGTPDLPNVQQTYMAGAAGSRISAGSQELLSHPNSAVSPQAGMRNPFDNPAAAQYHEGHQSYDHEQQQQLQVRNLVPNAGGHLSAGQRPVSTASSFADPEDAYGGVY